MSDLVKYREGKCRGGGGGVTCPGGGANVLDSFII